MRTVRTARNLRHVLFRNGKFKEAALRFREVVAFRAARGIGSSTVIARDRSILGVCLTRLGRFDEAEPELLEALRVFKKAPTRAHVEGTIRRLAALYDAWGKPDEAADWRAKLPSDTSEQE